MNERYTIEVRVIEINDSGDQIDTVFEKKSKYAFTDSLELEYMANKAVEDIENKLINGISIGITPLEIPEDYKNDRAYR